MLDFSDSKDGIPRATMYIRFRVGQDVLESALAIHLRAETPEDDHANLEAMRKAAHKVSYTLLEKVVRNELAFAGYELYWTLEDAEPAILQAARERVRQLYPDLCQETPSDS